MALAEALTVNTTLRKIVVCRSYMTLVQGADDFSASVYDAFSAMLRVNTSLVLKLPLFDDRDERLIDSRNQMRIEQGLNQAPRHCRRRGAWGRRRGPASCKRMISRQSDESSACTSSLGGPTPFRSPHRSWPPGPAS